MVTFSKTEYPTTFFIHKLKTKQISIQNMSRSLSQFLSITVIQRNSVQRNLKSMQVQTGLNTRSNFFSQCNFISTTPLRSERQFVATKFNKSKYFAATFSKLNVSMNLSSRYNGSTRTTIKYMKRLSIELSWENQIYKMPCYTKFIRCPRRYYKE